MLLFLMGISQLELFLLLVLFALWMWAFVEVVTGRFRDGTTKLIWLLLVTFIPLIGWVLYMLIGRRQRVKNSQNT